MSQEGTQYTQGKKGGDSSSNTWISNLFQRSCRPFNERKVGLEVERLASWEDLSPFLYTDTSKHPGAGTLLAELSKEYKWKPVYSPTDALIGLNTGTGSVSLEPGSQVEISLQPSGDLISALNAVDTFEKQVSKITKPWGLSWLGIGVNPLHQVADTDIIPSPRYGFMTDYFEKSGKYGTSMMRLTSSIQVNLDYSSETEAIEMFKVALLAAPISYLLFSNSPFYGGIQTDFLSFRAEIWRNTDPARTGLLPELFQPGFGFKQLADYFWNQPLMFAQDPSGTFIPAFGKSLLAVATEENPPFPVNENNQWNAIRELFTEARLKPGFVEVRSIDGLLPTQRGAAVAFWTGLLYGEESRKLAIELLGGLGKEKLYLLWKEISREGFRTSFGSINLLEITKKLLMGCKDVLKKRGFKEEMLLEPAFECLETKLSPADVLLDHFKNKWGKKIDKVIEASRF